MRVGSSSRRLKACLIDAWPDGRTAPQGAASALGPRHARWSSSCANSPAPARLRQTSSTQLQAFDSNITEPCSHSRWLCSRAATQHRHHRASLRRRACCCMLKGRSRVSPRASRRCERMLLLSSAPLLCAVSPWTARTDCAGHTLRSTFGLARPGKLTSHTGRCIVHPG